MLDNSEDTNIASSNLITVRMDMIRQFDESPNGALFDQKIVAAKLDVSTAQLEKLRWAGGGVPFVKLGRSVKYRKTDVLEFIEARVCRSTSSIAAA
jgi:hypothetical protein